MLGYYDTKYMDQAEWAYSEAAKLSPKRQQVYYSWGRLRLARRDYAGALEVIKKSLNDNPRIPDSHWYVGLTYYMSGDKENAKREIDEAIKLNYAWKSAHEPSLVGDLYFDAKDYKTAAMYYEKAVLQGAQGETYYHLAKTYAVLGNKVRARKYAAKALDTVADNLKSEVKQFISRL